MESYYTEDTAGALADAQEVQSGCVFTPGADVLLVQDVVPWAAASNQSPLGANVTQLECMGARFDICTADRIGVIALNQYREIVISAAQTQHFYDSLFPGGFIHFALVNWVQQGGILSANLADHASGPGAGGNWDGRVFLAGVQKVFETSNDNGIADAQHPIITGAFGGCDGAGQRVWVPASPGDPLSSSGQEGDDAGVSPARAVLHCGRSGLHPAGVAGRPLLQWVRTAPGDYTLMKLSVLRMNTVAPPTVISTGAGM